MKIYVISESYIFISKDNFHIKNSIINIEIIIIIHILRDLIYFFMHMNSRIDYITYFSFIYSQE